MGNIQQVFSDQSEIEETLSKFIAYEEVTIQLLAWLQDLDLDMVLGFRGFDCRNNLHYLNDGTEIVYHAAGAGVVLSMATGEGVDTMWIVCF